MVVLSLFDYWRSIRWARGQHKPFNIASTMVGLFIFAYTNAFAQSDAQQQRLKQSAGQLLSALVVEHELAIDSDCRSKSYEKINIRSWISHLPDSGGQSEGEKRDMERQITGALNAQTRTKNANGTMTLSRIAYVAMKDPIVKIQTDAAGEKNVCDLMDKVSKGLYSKAIDNLELLKLGR